MVGMSGKVQDLNCNHQVDTDMQKSMVSEAENYKLIQYLRNTVKRIRERVFRPGWQGVGKYNI